MLQAHKLGAQWAALVMSLITTATVGKLNLTFAKLCRVCLREPFDPSRSRTLGPRGVSPTCVGTNENAVSLISFRSPLSPLSSEYYLGTVPFQADPRASRLQVDLINAPGDIHEAFIIDIKNQPFSTPNHVVKALDGEIQRKLNEISERWMSASRKRITMPKVEFGHDEVKNSFWFSINKTTQGFRLQLGKNDPKSILTKLGFSEGMLVEHRPDDPRVDPPVDPRVLAEKEWTMGNGGEHGGRSLHEQRVRSDEGFCFLRSRFEAKFGKKRNTAAPKDKGERPKDKGEGPGHKDGGPEDDEKALHSENLLLAEYLFSLAFLSIFRVRGPTLRINANKPVDGASVDDFENRLEMVCNFDVGATEPEGPGSLKKVMEEVVKKVSSHVYSDGPWSPLRMRTQQVLRTCNWQHSGSRRALPVSHSKWRDRTMNSHCQWRDHTMKLSPTPPSCSTPL